MCFFFLFFLWHFVFVSPLHAHAQTLHLQYLLWIIKRQKMFKKGKNKKQKCCDLPSAVSPTLPSHSRPRWQSKIRPGEACHNSVQLLNNPQACAVERRQPGATLIQTDGIKICPTLTVLAPFANDGKARGENERRRAQQRTSLPRTQVFPKNNYRNRTAFHPLHR